MCPTRGSTRYPELTRRRGHVAAGEWSARRWCVAQARGARLASGFGRFKRPEAQFSSQKFTTEPIFLSSAPVFAPRMQFSSGFRYRSVEEDVTDAKDRLHAGRSVACKEAIRNIPSTSPPINRGHLLPPQHTPTHLSFISPSYLCSSVPLGVLHLVLYLEKRRRVRVEERRRSRACQNLLSFCTSTDPLHLELHPGYHSVFLSLLFV